MHKIFMGIMALIVMVAMVALPVAAMPNPYYGGNSHTQIADVDLHGNNNNQQVDNTYNENNYNGETEQNAKSNVKGNNNNVNTVNNNMNVNGGDVINGATSVSNNQQMTLVIPKSTSYYGLDTGVITDKQILSLYMGQVLIVDNDAGNMQHAGDKFVVMIQSSVPVLAYEVNNNEAKRAEFDIDVAPTYDIYQHKFDVSNLDTIFVSKYRSPQQQFEVTIPENGMYSLVIDTRVTQSLDGKTTPITPDSVDLIYSIAKTFNGTPMKFNRNVIGSTDMYPIGENGQALTQ